MASFAELAGFDSENGTYSAWLLKDKSDTAVAKWLQSSTRRFYTIDFKKETIYYRHSEDQKRISQPIHFKELIGAEVLLPTSSKAFLLKTQNRTYKLRATSSQHAAQWVHALNNLKEEALRPATSSDSIDAVHGEEEIAAEPPPLGAPSTLATSSSQPRSSALDAPGLERQESDASASRITDVLAEAADAVSAQSQRSSAAVSVDEAAPHADSRQNGGVGSFKSSTDSPESKVSDDKHYESAVRKLSCEMRMAAADQIGHARWAKMSWRERFVAAEAVSILPVEVRLALGGARTMPTDSQSVTSSFCAADFAAHDDGTGQKRQLVVRKRYSLALNTLTKAERLKAVFDTHDGLRMLVGHHVEELVLSVIGAMQLMKVNKGDVLVRQGDVSNTFFIVEDGVFDVLVTQTGKPGRAWQELSLTQYTPGAVFGEHALVSSAPRAATVVASSAGQVWTLDRMTFEQKLKDPEDLKTIGLVGGIMMLINNLAGPTIVSMPGLAQEAGWLSVVLVQALIAALSCGCGFMLLEAMRKMPGNRNFEHRIEFTNLALFYLPHWLYVFVMFCYHVNSILSLMSLIIQSGQVMDYLTLNMYGCTPGIRLGRRMGYICGTRTDSVTPFGDVYVISSSMVVVGAICAPFAIKNLDDNIILQYLAIIGLSLMSVVWINLLVSEPTFPQTLPVVTSRQGGLIGTVLFNFAFTSTLPSWVNDKKQNVSVAWTFGITMVYVVVVYSVVGMIGGMAYPPFHETDENLFSKLNAGGSKLGRATVTAYPMLQNFTSIPVFSVLIRYNLLQSGMEPMTALFVAVALPWILSVPCYTGAGFDMIAEYGGLLTSSVINFITPVVFFFLAKAWAEETGTKPAFSSLPMPPWLVPTLTFLSGSLLVYGWPTFMSILGFQS